MPLAADATRGTSRLLAETEVNRRRPKSAQYCLEVRRELVTRYGDRPWAGLARDVKRRYKVYAHEKPRVLAQRFAGQFGAEAGPPWRTVAMVLDIAVDVARRDEARERFAELYRQARDEPPPGDPDLSARPDEADDADRLRRRLNRVEFDALDKGHKLRNEIHWARAQAERAQKAAGRARAEAARSRAEAEQARTEADRARADSEQAHADADHARAEAERARADATRAHADADHARAEAERARADAARAHADADHARADAERARADAARAHADAERARRDVTRLREEQTVTRPTTGRAIASAPAAPTTPTAASAALTNRAPEGNSTGQRPAGRMRWFARPSTAPLPRTAPTPRTTPSGTAPVGAPDAGAAQGRTARPNGRATPLTHRRATPPPPHGHATPATPHGHAKPATPHDHVTPPTSHVMPPTPHGHVTHRAHGHVTPPTHGCAAPMAQGRVAVPTPATPRPAVARVTARHRPDSAPTSAPVTGDGATAFPPPPWLVPPAPSGAPLPPPFVPIGPAIRAAAPKAGSVGTATHPTLEPDVVGAPTSRTYRPAAVRRHRRMTPWRRAVNNLVTRARRGTAIATTGRHDGGPTAPAATAPDTTAAATTATALAAIGRAWAAGAPIPGEPRAGMSVAARYVLASCLTGGTGHRWVAWDRARRCHVRLRRITSSADGRSEALRLAHAAARLAHPSIQPVHAVLNDAHAWIVTDAPSGRTLTEVVRHDGPMSEPRAGRIALAIADALAAAHRAGVVHGRLSPDDVVLDADDRVSVTGFGIDPDFTSRPAADYAAPERLGRERPDAAADLWSLGAVLHFAVTGVPPFSLFGYWRTPGAIRRTLTWPIEAPRAERLKRVLRWLCQTDRRRRPSVRQVRRHLRRLASEHPVTRRASEHPVTRRAAPPSPELAFDPVRAVFAPAVRQPVSSHGGLARAPRPEPTSRSRQAPRPERSGEHPHPGPAARRAGDRSRWRFWLALVVAGAIVVVGGAALSAMATAPFGLDLATVKSIATCVLISTALVPIAIATGAAAD
ncbi:protein kinase domain-containing protein [Dactylosporangium sp. CA-052675]|uniref:protein kinase domain-containing protein n=1 Tax=Dactylosporangium sp. CA-052675 TaxID=3239927 RepID=UPI003D8ADFB1